MVHMAFAFALLLNLVSAVAFARGLGLWAIWAVGAFGGSLIAAAYGVALAVMPAAPAERSSGYWRRDPS